MERFAVEEWVDAVDAHRPVVSGLPPAGLQMLLDANVNPQRLSSLRAVTVGTAPASADLLAAFEERFGIAPLVTYGATEFAGAICGWTLDDHRVDGERKRGSVGRAHPGIELRVTDPESGDPLAAGASGILEARGGQLSIAGSPSWVRTNDLAHLDDDGYLFIDGRVDDVINRGGFKVSAGSVATALETHPGVGRAGVVGRPDRRLGHVPVAVLEVIDRDLTDDQLRVHLQQLLAPYQVPTRFIRVDVLPLTATMKVDGRALAELVDRIEGTPAVSG